MVIHIADPDPLIARRPRIGGMATMPSRLAELREILARVVPQLHRLYLYLDGHGGVPDFARHPKIVPLFPSNEGRWGSGGKFLGLAREPLGIVYVTLDDDIFYPLDYVETLVAALVRHGGRAAVGFHGDLFLPPYASFVRDRAGYPFMAALAEDIRVDILGTGTVAFLPSRLPLMPRQWPFIDLDDFMFALTAERAGMPRVAIARSRNYLQALGYNQPDSHWVAAQRDDSRQVRFMNELIALEQKSPLGPPPRPAVTTPQPPAPPA